MKTWTCEEIDEYWKLENIRLVINYLTMGTQILLFIVLIFILAKRRCFGTGQVTCMTILICVFVIMNGVFSIIRVNENFLDYYTKGEGYDIYQVTYGLESICFIGAIWFYGIIYY